MASELDSFEVNRWHSPEYVESWATDQAREERRRPLRRKLVSLLPFERMTPIRVLDLGVGTGALSLEVITAYPQAELVCQDFSEAMIARARERLAAYSGQVTFVKSDLRDPGWRDALDGNFDAVVTSFVMHTVVRDIRDIYHRAFSLVRPGGCFLNCDHVAAPGPSLAAIYARERLVAYRDTVRPELDIGKSLEEIERRLRNPRQDRVRNGRPTVPPITTQIEWLKIAGFDEVDCLWKDTRRAILGAFRHEYETLR